MFADATRRGHWDTSSLGASLLMISRAYSSAATSPTQASVVAVYATVLSGSYR